LSTKKLQLLSSVIKQAENADTIDGKHADEFAATSDVNNLKTLVGDVAVSEQISDAVSQKSQVQMVTEGTQEVLSTLKIHKLTQAEYDQQLAAGTIDENALYLTPDEELDLSPYATKEYVDSEIATIPTPDVSGQIETHNTNPDAHEDIRALISSSVAQKSQVQIITWGDDD
jgi:hypothetical protein